MSLTLTTFASGAVIDASTMYAKVASIELYLNEQTVAADRGSAWADSNQIYRPDFFGAPCPHTTLTSGESYYQYVGRDVASRRYSTQYLNTTSWIPVPGLCTTIQIPESLRQGSYYYRLAVFASFYVYEWGAQSDATNGLDQDSKQAGSVSLHIAGTDGLAPRKLMKGSMGASGPGPTDLNNTAYYPRKHVSMAYVSTDPQSNGVYNVGVLWRNNATTPNLVKHVIFAQGNLVARYYLR